MVIQPSIVTVAWMWQTPLQRKYIECYCVVGPHKKTSHAISHDCDVWKNRWNLIFFSFLDSCDKTIHPHYVLPNEQKKLGSELRKNAYTKRFHCSLNGFKLEVKQFEADSGLRLRSCDSHLKLDSARRRETEEAFRGGKVRVQVCSFENHIMVMMAQTCPHALLGKVISISA